MQLADLTGQRFGRLTVISYSHERKVGARHHLHYWLCKCECGNETATCSQSLARGSSTSCGCLRDELRRKHGGTGTPEHDAWENMRDRCRNPKNPQFKDYGGRGITVCQEWDDFNVFLGDVGPRPSPEHQIDRKDNNGNYCKENCRWTTRKVQMNNRRNNRMLTIYGKTLTVQQWCDISGVSWGCVGKRLRMGWPVRYAVFAPSGSRLDHIIAKYGPCKEFAA